MNSSASPHHPPVSICTANASIDKIVQIWSSNSLLDVPEVLFQKVANVAFGVPNDREGDSWYGRQISSVQKRKLLPMQNFVPRIPPADPVWSSNHASDHTSKVDIKFDHICIVDASGPSSQTSDWCHEGIEEFQFVSNGHISAQKIHFLAKKRCGSQTANGNQYPELHRIAFLEPAADKHTTQPFVTRFLLLYLDNGSSRSSQKWCMAELALWWTRCFPHLISGLHHPKNCTSLSNNVMISCEDLANIKISFANLQAGFTHVQLTVADWLQLGGGVERKVEKPEPANPPDSAATSDYSDRLHLLHRSRRRDHPGRACTSLPSVEERHSAKLCKWTTSFSAQEPVTRAPPRVRQLPAPPFPDGPRCRNVGPEQPRPKTECPTKGTPQRTPLKGQGKAHRGGKG